jgi:glycerophosphoryl diester phosphodiesterase
MVLVIAHRGASGYYPENTMKSIENAIKMGSDMVEIDLKMTKDKHIVLMHDDAVDRTTNGHGLVQDLTTKQLRTLDAGGGEKVPLLTEVIGMFGGRGVRFMFDISSKGYEEQLTEIIHRHNLDVGTIVSGAHEPLRLIKLLNPRLRIAPSFEKASDLTIMETASMGAEVFNCHHAPISRETVDMAHVFNLQVIAWGVNNIEHIHRMIEIGVDGITSDYPDVVRRAISSPPT